MAIHDTSYTVLQRTVSPGTSEHKLYHTAQCTLQS